MVCLPESKLNGFGECEAKKPLEDVDVDCVLLLQFHSRLSIPISGGQSVIFPFFLRRGFSALKYFKLIKFGDGLLHCGSVAQW